MIRGSALFLASALFALPVSAGPVPGTPKPVHAADLIRLASSYSCSGRKTCTRIGSCDEAYWYLANCSWGGKLDRDNDGVPCETICPGG